MEEEQIKIENEISELEQLINKAEQSRDDPQLKGSDETFS
jgi:hypothetical protein